MDSRVTSDTLDIEKLLKIFLDYKKFIIIGTFCTSLFCIIYSLLLTPIYKSSALLEPNPNVQSSSGMPSLAGPAAVIGLDISSATGNGADIFTVATEVVLSKDFLERIIQEDALFLPELMAVKSYDKSKNNIVFDESIYNSDKKEWVLGDAELHFSFHEIYEKFIIDHIEVQRDQLSKLTTISIYHSSPYVAKRWLDMILLKINTIMRDKKLSETRKSVDFLNQQLNETNIKELRTAISNSIKKELNSFMYAQISSDYIFKVIDSPRVSTVQAKPNKKSIVIIGTIIGFIFLTIITLVYEYVLAYRKKYLQ